MVNKMVIFFVGSEHDLPIMNEICDILWEGHKIATTLEIKKNIPKLDENGNKEDFIARIKSFLKGDKNKIFVVNEMDDVLYKKILELFLSKSVSVNRLNFQGPNSNWVELAAEVADSFIIQ